VPLNRPTPRTPPTPSAPRGGQPPSRPAGRTGAGPGRPLSTWGRQGAPADREAAGRNWRAAEAGWDTHTLWRRNPGWWRTDRSFRGYGGVRAGFFFVPGRGYVRAPPIYQRHYWPPGDILPEWYWRYEIADYGRYGLPMPPDGCRWVWVDDDVALIDADGFILDVVRNVW
jgi:Ni/Co efflux regulator RcnB